MCLTNHIHTMCSPNVITVMWHKHCKKHWSSTSIHVVLHDTQQGCEDREQWSFQRPVFLYVPRAILARMLPTGLQRAYSSRSNWESQCADLRMKHTQESCASSLSPEAKRFILFSLRLSSVLTTFYLQFLAWLPSCATIFAAAALPHTWESLKY